MLSGGRSIVTLQYASEMPEQAYFPFIECVNHLSLRLQLSREREVKTIGRIGDTLVFAVRALNQSISRQLFAT